ncbi:MAG: hypothetical protein AAGC60_27630 [Acidobacteriota bacterium]
MHPMPCPRFHFFSPGRSRPGILSVLQTLLILLAAAPAVAAGSDDERDAHRIWGKGVADTAALPADLEAAYGHPLTEANLDDIRAWRVHDLAWWLDYDRNLAAHERSLVLAYHASNSSRTIEDARQHEELFGIHYLPPNGPVKEKDLRGVLVHDRILRPDLIVLSDEIEEYFLDVVGPHLPAQWAKPYKEEALFALATTIAADPTVQERLGHRRHLELWHKWTPTEIDQATRDFVFYGLTFLVPELRNVYQRAVADEVTRWEASAVALRDDTRVDLRLAYDEAIRTAARADFDRTFSRVDSFLSFLGDEQRGAFLLFMLNEELQNEIDVRPVVPTALNLDLMTDLDVSLRGIRAQDYRFLIPPMPTPGLVQVTIKDMHNLVLKKCGRIQYNADGSVAQRGEAILRLETGATGPYAEVKSFVPFLLYFFNGSLDYSPTLYGPDNGTTLFERNSASKLCSFMTRFPFSMLGKEMMCRLESDQANYQFWVNAGGAYVSKPELEFDVNFSTELAISNPALSLTAEAGAVFAGGQLTITTPDISMTLKPDAFNLSSSKSALITTDRVFFKKCPPNGNRTPGQTCQVCPDGMIEDEERGCVCEGDLVMVEDGDGNATCVELCEARPELCDPPPLGPGTLEVRVPQLETRPVFNDPWNNDDDQPTGGHTCKMVEKMVCTDRWIDPPGVMATECEVRLVCENEGSNKRIDCTKGHWWTYCEPKVSFVDTLPPEVYCSPGATRCLGGSLSQICRSDGFWGDVTVCPSGCDQVTGSCSGGGVGQCTDGTSRCLSATTAQYCLGGAWGPVETCVEGCDSSTQACRPPAQCTDGARRCTADGTRVQLCESGAWGTQILCAYGCDPAASECRTSSPSCAGTYPGRCDWAGTRTCNGFGDVLVCDFNAEGCLAWQVAEDCTDGCAGGACTGSSCSGPDLCTVDGAGRCADAGTAEVCQLTGDGCLRWSAPAGGGSCAAGEVCKAGVCTTQSCQADIDCWESSRSCQNGICAPCAVDADCGGAPWVCSQTTRSCYAAF